MKVLATDMRAPNFTLQDECGASINLSAFYEKKNVLLIFYPGDMTPGCTMQLCAIRDEWPKFIDANIAVFGINHADAESHKIFKGKYKFPFPLFVDKAKKVSRTYDAIRKLGKLETIKRTVVGIDKTGTIVYLKRGMPKNADILKVFKARNRG